MPTSSPPLTCSKAIDLETHARRRSKQKKQQPAVAAGGPLHYTESKVADAMSEPPLLTIGPSRLYYEAVRLLLTYKVSAPGGGRWVAATAAGCSSSRGE